MRWDDLFDDLEQQLDERLAEERALEEIEAERLRLGRLTLRDRLRALSAGLAADESIGLVLADETALELVPATFGADWIAGDVVSENGARRACVLAIGGISLLRLRRDQVRRSLAEVPAPPPGDLSGRLGIAYPLRDLARRRAVCDILSVRGRLAGTIDRVGRDHIDVALHDPADARRDRAVRSWAVVGLDDVMLVRLAP